MTGTCVVTGGAGFIGCALSSPLAARYERVVAFDNLHPQVHATASRPAALDPRVELVRGDVTQESDWSALLGSVTPSVVIHLAAETGTAQSLTTSSRHGLVNVVGTTRMLDALALGPLPERIVLASSRAVYGEGAWQDSSGETVYPGQRSHAMLERAEWDFPGLFPLPSAAARVEPRPSSVYAATKLAQEHLVRSWSLAFGVQPVVLRLQNVYGAGQSLTNPYTGILPLFARLGAAGQPIPVYEDGAIVRDFVHVDDVVTALVACLSADIDPRSAVDIGSGEPRSIAEVAGLIATRYGSPPPLITGEFRDGDVRFASADISLARELLRWSPRRRLADGLESLCDWIDQPRDLR